MKTNVIEQTMPGVGFGSKLKSKTQKLFQKFRKANTQLLNVILLIVIAGSFLTGCNEDDEVLSPEPWQQELDLLRSAVAPYTSLELAIAEGYDNEFTGYRLQMGFHYMKAALVDDTFEVDKPEVLMFAPDSNGNMQFVGVEYAIPIADMGNPPPAPEGFTGDVDEWAINTEFNVWTLHVWVGIDNPSGIFQSHNPTLP